MSDQHIVVRTAKAHKSGPARVPRAERPKRMALKKKQWSRILAKSCGSCVYCGFGKDYSADIVIEIDHFVPLSRGGTNAMSNLVAACSDCNAEKSDMLVEEYRAYLEALTDAPYWLFDYENGEYGPDAGIISQEELEHVLRRCQRLGAVFGGASRATSGGGV